MPDRIGSITVVLERDLLEEDAEDICKAIRQLRGVIEAKANVVDIMQFGAEQRAAAKLRRKVWEVLHTFDGGEGPTE